MAIYGEQRTFYFYYQVQHRRSKTSWTAVAGHDGHDIPLDTPEDRVRAGEKPSDFFSSDILEGLFRPRACDAFAQLAPVNAVDKTLSPHDRELCKGKELLTLDELAGFLTQAYAQREKPRFRRSALRNLPAFWGLSRTHHAIRSSQRLS